MFLVSKGSPREVLGSFDKGFLKKGYFSEKKNELEIKNQLKLVFIFD